MTDNGICSLLGLAWRAGKLAAGDEPVRELSRAGVVRVVFLASDAGAAVTRQAEYIAGRAGVPLLRLPVTGEALGGALGRKTCAVCALSDSGFAAKAAEKLAALDPAVLAAAETLAGSHARFQARRGRKKHAQPQESPGSRPPKPPEKREQPPERGKAPAGQRKRAPQRDGASRKQPDSGGRGRAPERENAFRRRETAAPLRSRGPGAKTGAKRRGRAENRRDSAPAGGKGRFQLAGKPNRRPGKNGNNRQAAGSK